MIKSPMKGEQRKEERWKLEEQVDKPKFKNQKFKK